MSESQGPHPLRHRKQTRRLARMFASAIAVTALVSACSSAAQSPNAPDQNRAAVYSTAAGRPDPGYPAGTNVQNFVYSTTDQDHNSVQSSAMLLIPPGDAPAGGWPIVAWDHGTTGMGDDCAPSTTSGPHYYAGSVSALLHAGYAVVATDYVGLGTPGTHTYLVADSAGRATIDSVRAAKTIDSRLSDRWASVGHSQGGQASWATNELAGSYGSGLDYRGAVAMAPVSSLSKDIDQVAGASDPIFQMYYVMILAGMRTQEEFDYADYLGEQARSTLPSLEKLCVMELAEYFAKKSIPADQFTFRSSQAREKLVGLLREHETGHSPLSRPLLVLHGTADVDTPIEGIESAIADAKRLGGNVTFTAFPGVGHDELATAGMPETIKWLADKFSSNQ
ncbi:alpha/beta fold hydrolase [Nocardia sp. NPDC003183]